MIPLLEAVGADVDKEAVEDDSGEVDVGEDAEVLRKPIPIGAKLSAIHYRKMDSDKNKEIKKKKKKE